MPDKEKVIKGLEECIGNGKCTKCEYGKEKQALSCKKLLIDVLALLKEREPVKPVNLRWEMGINGGNCPKCMNWVQRTYNYCPFCGKVAKWN